MTLESLLDTALEHSSHAWRDLEVRGIVTEQLDGPWPPSADGAPVGSTPYHLAAMIKYIKLAYDKVSAFQEREDE